MVLMLILMFCVVGYWFVDDAIVLCCSRRLRLSLQEKDIERDRIAFGI